jgi:hypothetical protein
VANTLKERRTAGRLGVRNRPADRASELLGITENQLRIAEEGRERA